MSMTNHERATKAAAARWGGERMASARIYVDDDVAAMLKKVKPKARQREIASEAIRNALKNRQQRVLN